MKYISTRQRSEGRSFSEAIQAGLALDGGLYVPEHFPSFPKQAYEKAKSLPKIAEEVLRPFIKGDVLESSLNTICKKALSFPIPLRILDDNTAVLELFHGPTAAFKDVGARFLAEFTQADQKQRTVLVATSGDTGGAVASAFYGRSNIEVIILYPKNRISPRQEKQLTCWGKDGNIRAFAVRGDFDDCQRMAKEALRTPAWTSQRSLMSANSINLGRLLPQMIYYAASSLEYHSQTGKMPGYIIPSGNLGNAVAAFWAKRVGFPIRETVLATNANRSILDYLKLGKWTPHPTVVTLANAMDVGNPSNIERLISLYPDLDVFRSEVRAISVNDTEITQSILNGLARWKQIWCPHTATAAHVRDQLNPDIPWIIVATAHPAKFEAIIEPIIGKKVELPESLVEILSRPSISTEIGPSLNELEQELFRGKD